MNLFKLILIIALMMISLPICGQNFKTKSIEDALNSDGTIKNNIKGSYSAEGYSINQNNNGKLVLKKNISPNSIQAATWFTLGTGVGGSLSEVVFSDGNLYVSGLFTTAGGNSANYIAKWNGNTWSTLGSGLNGRVQGMAISGNNIYVTGEFTTAGGVSANHIAKWNGSNWSALGGGLDNDGWCIAVQGDDVYVGGKFLTVNNYSLLANNIAHWNGSSWQQMGTGMDSYVHKLVVHEGFVYAVGRFTTAGGSSANRIAKWNGSAWSTLGTGLNNWVHDIACSGENVFVGGAFTTAGGVSTNYIAKWNGTSWAALGTGLNNIAMALLISGEELYVGGLFTSAGGVSVNKIAKWNGVSWSALGSGILEGTPTTYVDDIARDGTVLYVGGTFSRLGDGRTANYIAQLGGSSSATAAVRNTIVGGGSSVNFNAIGHVTAVTINLGADAGSGEIDVYRYDDAPENAASIAGNVSNYRWIVLPENLSPTFTGSIRIKLSEIPSAGITNPNSVKVYSRSTPGNGAFGELTTTYDSANDELVASISSFSEFAFSSETDPVPVELNFLSGDYLNADIMLNWQTATEVSNYGFEIERKNNTNDNWENIGFVDGHGNSNSPKDYSFVDDNPIGNKISYRLKQIDTDGSFEYSEIVVVISEIPLEYKLSQNYPNPFNPSTIIEFAIPTSGNVKLSIFNSLGQEVAVLINEEMSAGNYMSVPEIS